MKPTPDRIDRGLYWDRAWSLVEGCTPVSAACDNCWAAKAAHMRKGHPNIHISMDNSGITNKDGRFNGAVRHRHDLLNLPLSVKKPTVWAIWTDLFHETVPFEFISRAWDTMFDCGAVEGPFRRLYSQHLFLVLTKRPERIIEFEKWMNASQNRRIDYRNIWLGVTVENQQTADERIPLLLQTPAAKRFVSVEPMLGPVELTKYLTSTCTDCTRSLFQCREWKKNKNAIACCPDCNHPPMLDWVICGWETGPNARPMHPDWARSLRDQCRAAGVPFFFKGRGKHLPDGQRKRRLDGEIIMEFPE